MRSYWSFFLWIRLFVTIFLLATSVLFWSVIRKVEFHLDKSIVALLSLTFVATVVVAWKHFFLAPAITELLVAICLAMAFFRTA